MHQLHIFPIGSFFDNKYLQFTATAIDESHPFPLALANELFWGEHFSKTAIRTIVEMMKDIHSDFPPAIVQHEAIINNPDLFMEAVEHSLDILRCFGHSKEMHFSARETLAIVCNIFSEFQYAPFVLDIDSGFLMEDYSADFMLETCMKEELNPYLPFLEKHIFPYIKEHKPELLWLNGKPDYYSMAIAKYARSCCSNLHISLTEHHSEYFSLNTMSKHLKQNTALFSLIDSIVLDDFQNTPKLLANALQAKESLSSVPNILFAYNGEIHQTDYNAQVPKLSFPSGVLYPPVQSEDGCPVNRSQMLAVKLWPECKCYWNKCTYCNINSKYKTLNPDNDFGNIEEKADFIEQATKKGYKALHFSDEAVPPLALSELAKELLKRGTTSTYWSVRSRVDEAFTADTCKLLADAGLRSIYIGQESANSRILTLMNKFDDSYSLELSESIVQNFTDAGVAVNFCFIIGFPDETEQEKNETLNFIKEMKQKYSTFTYTINIFKLFMGSDLIDKSLFDKPLGIPCAPNDYMDNLVFWEGMEILDDLDDVKHNFLLQEEYPFIPEHAFTSFDSLATTMPLNNFIRRNFPNNDQSKEFDSKRVLLHTTVEGKQYNWGSHSVED